MPVGPSSSSCAGTGVYISKLWCSHISLIYLSFAKGLKQSHIFFWILKHIYWTHCLYVFYILKHICWAHPPPGVSGAEWIIINSDILTCLIYFLIFSRFSSSCAGCRVNNYQQWYSHIFNIFSHIFKGSHTFPYFLLIHICWTHPPPAVPGAECIDREETAVGLQGVPATAVIETVDKRAWS